jgi:Platelet-activating factor acetylhydrolase, isoform II
MRPLEILLVVVAAGALLASAFRLPHPLRLLTALVVALTVMAELLVDGPRWPMVPAYVLAGLLALVPLIPLVPPIRGHRRTTRLVALAVGVPALTVAVALPLVVPAYAFPPPDGPYAIGTLTYHWVDTGRPEILSADPDDDRELMVQIFYPAERVASTPRAPYLPDADAVADAMSGLQGFPRPIYGGLAQATTTAVPSAAPTTDGPAHPVLIFLEGLTGYRQMNTFQVEALVSHGYVVVAIDQPFIAAEVVYPDGHRSGTLPAAEMQSLLKPDLGPVAATPTLRGRPFSAGVVHYFAQDVGFVLDQLTGLNSADPNGILTGRLDLARTGLFGVSMGGIVGAEACRLDPRLRACLLMDAPMPLDVVRDGLAQPAMWITRDAATMQDEGWAQVDIVQHQTSMRAVFDSLRAPGYFVQVPGMFHADLTDIPELIPLSSLVGYTGPIGTGHAHDIVDAYSTAFFDRHLTGRPAPLLDEPPGQHPEVLVQTRDGRVPAAP